MLRADSRLLALLIGALPGCSEPADLPPSILLVSWDTVRRDHCSLYGYERETTPFLEELARECVVYENAYTTASFTLIAHMSMLAGLYPAQHGVQEETALAPEIPLLAERLSELAYYNVAIFRGGWIDERFGYDRGFDVFLERNSAVLAEEAMYEVLDDRPRNRPLFLFLHLFDAHCQDISAPDSTLYVPPAEYKDLFREGAADRLRGRPAYDIFYGDEKTLPGEPEDLIALYDAGIRYLDDELSEWIEYWRDEGILDDALFILTADHGESLGQRWGKWDGHGSMWQEGIRIPLVVRYPDGSGAGTREDRLTSIVDFVPTVLDMLGLEAEPWLPGRSLRSERADGETIYAERKRMISVTDGRHKMTGSKLGRGIRVYDIESDPDELVPIRGDELTSLHASLMERADAVRALVPPGEPIPAAPPSEETRADLDAIGYGGGE